MSIMEQIQRLLARGEVDEIDRAAGRVTSWRAQASDEEHQLAAFREGVVNGRHPDLSAAIERRNAAR